ncbi:MAG: hypothetical protein HEQ27_18870 [Dolichospermum sp. JUN01]|jgi:hypothetical protein|nr:hypothetical protein [Dolichospermum sp. JUN01]QSV53102.1 MAG: hypothetical protein HEP80_03405 [Dolichospermum sp. UKL201]
MNIPQPMKTTLAQLATFPEQYTLMELASELELLALRLRHAHRVETELTQSALKIE